MRSCSPAGSQGLQRRGGDRSCFLLGSSSPRNSGFSHPRGCVAHLIPLFSCSCSFSSSLSSFLSPSPISSSPPPTPPHWSLFERADVGGILTHSWLPAVLHPQASAPARADSLTPMQGRVLCDLVGRSPVPTAAGGQACLGGEGVTGREAIIFCVTRRVLLLG